MIKSLVKNLPSAMVEGLANTLADQLIKGLQAKATQLKEVASEGSIVGLVCLPGPDDIQVNFNEILVNPNGDGYIFGKPLLEADISIKELAASVKSTDLIYSLLDGKFNSDTIGYNLPNPITEVIIPEPNEQIDIEENHLLEQEMSQYPIESIENSKDLAANSMNLTVLNETKTPPVNE